MSAINISENGPSKKRSRKQVERYGTTDDQLNYDQSFILAIEQNGESLVQTRTEEIPREENELVAIHSEAIQSEAIQSETIQSETNQTVANQTVANQTEAIQTPNNETIPNENSISPTIDTILSPGEKILCKMIMEMAADIKALKSYLVESTVLDSKRNIKTVNDVKLREVGLPLKNQMGMGKFEYDLLKEEFKNKVVSH